LNELFPQRGKLLEIGSFMGIFLNHIRADGWDVTGLEPYRPVADYARSQYGLKIIEALLPAAGLPDGGFDAVVMLHVIEHMPDPSQNLREIRRILRRSISNCNGHIFFFTVPTLRQLIEKNGFEVFRVDLVGRTLTADRLLTNFGIMSRSDWIKRWLSRFRTALHLDRVCVYVNVKDMQRVYSRVR
jgi:SAM-dependent methyltransferase